MSHWSAIKEKSCGYLPMLLLLKIYKLFGKKALKFCLYPIVFTFYSVSAQTRKISAQYLSRVQEVKSGTPHLSVFKHIFSFADALVDKIIAWSGNLPLEIINIKTKDIYDEFFSALNNKQGAFLICSHLGNMEVFRALARVNENDILNEKLKTNALMQIEHTADFNKLMKKLNPDVETNIISAMDIGVDTIIDLKDRLNNGELVITSGDRTAAKNQDKTVAIDFLGGQANFPQGSFILASLMEAPIYYMFLLKESDESYSLYMYKSAVNFEGSRKKRSMKIEEAAKEYAGHMQELVLQYPYQWYNFFDFWRR